MVTFLVPSFDVMAERFKKLATNLEPSYRAGRLTYRDIRATMLKIPDLDPGYMYKPEIPLNVAVGDIGYVRGIEFIKLASIKDEIQGTSKRDEYLVASGPITSTDLADGVIRYVA